MQCACQTGYHYNYAKMLYGFSYLIKLKSEKIEQMAASIFLHANYGKLHTVTFLRMVKIKLKDDNK